MKFPISQGVAVVRGDQFVAKECMRIALKGKPVDSGILSIQQDETRPNTPQNSNPRAKDMKSKGETPTREVPVADITEEIENVVLNPRFPDCAVQVGATLPTEIKAKVISLLRQYQQVFAWGPEDMPGVSPDLITHRLNVDPRVKPIQQKRRNFAPERSQAVTEEVIKLLNSKIVKEVFYPTWLSNPVMVKKLDDS